MKTYDWSFLEQMQLELLQKALSRQTPQLPAQLRHAYHPKIRQRIHTRVRIFK